MGWFDVDEGDGRKTPPSPQDIAAQYKAGLDELGKRNITNSQPSIRHLEMEYARRKAASWWTPSPETLRLYSEFPILPGSFPEEPKILRYRTPALGRTGGANGLLNREFQVGAEWKRNDYKAFAPSAPRKVLKRLRTFRSDWSNKQREPDKKVKEHQVTTAGGNKSWVDHLEISSQKIYARDELSPDPRTAAKPKHFRFWPIAWHKPDKIVEGPEVIAGRDKVSWVSKRLRIVSAMKGVRDVGETAASVILSSSDVFPPLKSALGGAISIAAVRSRVKTIKSYSIRERTRAEELKATVASLVPCISDDHLRQRLFDIQIICNEVAQSLQPLIDSRSSTRFLHLNNFEKAIGDSRSRLNSAERDYYQAFSLIIMHGIANSKNASRSFFEYTSPLSAAITISVVLF